MTELDYLMQAIQDVGFAIAIHSWRDTAMREMVYEVKDTAGRKSWIKVTDEMLARAVDPQAEVHRSVRVLLAQYFVSIKQVQAYNACLLLADARMELEALKSGARV